MTNKIIFVVYPPEAKKHRKKLWKWDGNVESFITEKLAQKYAKETGGFVSKQIADDEIYREVSKAEKSYLKQQKERTYLIIGDNNFWYATFDAKSDKEALQELKRIRRQIKRGVGSEFDEPSEASELYLYRADEISRCDI